MCFVLGRYGVMITALKLNLQMFIQYLLVWCLEFEKVMQNRCLWSNIFCMNSLYDFVSFHLICHSLLPVHGDPFSCFQRCLKWYLWIKQQIYDMPSCLVVYLFIHKLFFYKTVFPSWPMGHISLVAITWTTVNVPYLNLTHWGRDKMTAFSQTIFPNAFPWMRKYEFRLKFHWSLFLGVQLTIFQYRLR